MFPISWAIFLRIHNSDNCWEMLGKNSHMETHWEPFLTYWRTCEYTLSFLLGFKVSLNRGLGFMEFRSWGYFISTSKQSSLGEMWLHLKHKITFKCLNSREAVHFFWNLKLRIDHRRKRYHRVHNLTIYRLSTINSRYSLPNTHLMVPLLYTEMLHMIHYPLHQQIQKYTNCFSDCIVFYHIDNTQWENAFRRQGLKEA